MTGKKNAANQSALKMEVAGKPVTLLFAPEPNPYSTYILKKVLVDKNGVHHK